MGKVVKFPIQVQPKFKLRRSRRSRDKDPEKHGQLNLFAYQEKEDDDHKIKRLHADLTPFEEALLHDEHGDKNASDLYWKAIDAGDCIADSFCNLGILEYQSKRKAKAIEQFTSALKHDPSHFESHYNLANIYFDMENYELARFHYEVAAEIQDDFPNIYFNLGLVYAAEQKYDKAVMMLETYIESAPSAITEDVYSLLSKIRGLRNSH